MNHSIMKRSKVSARKNSFIISREIVIPLAIQVLFSLFPIQSTFSSSRSPRLEKVRINLILQNQA